MQIVPNGLYLSSYHGSITPSDAYDYCRNLKTGSTLGINSLEPHLQLNADFGACVYLAFSAYGGCSNISDSTGPTVSIRVNDYRTTTANLTGVMNLGGFYNTSNNDMCEYTACIWADTNNSYVTSLVANKGTRFVETCDNNANTSSIRGWATYETSGWTSSSYSNLNSSYPTLIRYRYLTVTSTSPGVDSRRTYRPVIWNR